MHDGTVMADDERSPIARARRLADSDAAAAIRVLAGLRGAECPFSEYVAACQLLSQIAFDDRARVAAFTARVAFVGNNTSAYTEGAMRLELSQRVAADVYTGEFDGWAGDLLVRGSGLERFAPDIVIVHLASLGLTTCGTKLDPVPGERLEAALRAFASRSRAHLVWVWPEPLAECTGGCTAADRWYRETIDAARAMAARLNADGIEVLTLDPVYVLTTVAGWAAPRYWAQGKLPMHPSACAALGRRLATIVEGLTTPRVKAVAVDCDDVLWGGQVGDLGPGGVNLSAFDTGSGYVRLQRLLKEASANGILLIALSKNDEATARAVFERRSEMLLSLDDFSAFMVNWAPKAQNLHTAVSSLNIGLDTVLFLDDSRFEREQMRAVCPEVLVLELPPDADEYAAVVAATALLERPIVTNEDRRRREVYARERQREAVRDAHMSVHEFLGSLDIRLIAQPIGTDNLTRVAQLLGKTNQFNLSNRRHAPERLAALASAPATYAYCFQLVDRFGDSGIVGVLIADPTDRGSIEIDTLVLSCRAFGRTAEFGMLEHLRRWSAARARQDIEGEYRPTARNLPVARFLEEAGFARTGSTAVGERYRYDVRRGAVAGVMGEIVDGETPIVPASQ